MKTRITIPHWLTGATLWSGEVECPISVSDGVKIGLAVMAALKKGVSLNDADLRGVFLYGENMSGAQLQGAHLDRCCIRNCNLTDADMGDVKLEASTFIGCILPKSFDYKKHLNYFEISMMSAGHKVQKAVKAAKTPDDAG